MSTSGSGFIKFGLPLRDELRNNRIYERKGIFLTFKVIRYTEDNKRVEKISQICLKFHSVAGWLSHNFRELAYNYLDLQLLKPR